MPRKTKSIITVEAGANAQHAGHARPGGLREDDRHEIEQVLEMPKLERQTNEKRKLF